MISHPTITPFGKKNNDVVRLVRASECEVDGDDICSAAFARRWRGFVVAVHRAFAILAQERAIFPFLHVFELCFMLSCLLRHREVAEVVSLISILASDSDS